MDPASLSPSPPPLGSAFPSSKSMMSRYSERLAACTATVRSTFDVPWTKDNLLFHYLPINGVVNYKILSLCLLNPKLVKNVNNR